MSGYLDEYGAGEQKRVDLLRNLILLAVALVLVAGLAYYVSRTFHQVRVTKHFLSLLRDKKYPDAYEAWGCTQAHPCPVYAYDKFLEDWGPKSDAGTDPVLKIRESETCNSGVIVKVQVSGQRKDDLWMERSSDALSF